MKLFWCKIYCASPRPKPDSQSGSCSWNVPCRRVPQIMKIISRNCYWNLSVNYLCTWETSSSILLAMGRLTFLSITWSYFPWTPQMKRPNEEKYFRLLWQWLPHLTFFLFPTEIEVFQLSPYCRIHSRDPQILCQWWRQYLSPRSP